MILRWIAVFLAIIAFMVAGEDQDWVPFWASVLVSTLIGFFFVWVAWKGPHMSGGIRTVLYVVSFVLLALFVATISSFPLNYVGEQVGQIVVYPTGSR